MLKFLKFLVVTVGATCALCGQAGAQGGLFRQLQTDCQAAGNDQNRCFDYSVCVTGAFRREFSPAKQLAIVLNPKDPDFLKWIEPTKRYCIDQARLPPEKPPAKITANDPDNTLLILTTAGLIKIALSPDGAPEHVASIKKLVREKYYDDRAFALKDLGEDSVSIPHDLSHMPAKIPMESSSKPVERGFVVMSGRDRNKLDSSAAFFITRRYNQNFNFTIVGQVAEGQDILDRLKAPDTRPRVFGYPAHLYFEPDRVLAMRIAGDANSSDIAELEKKKGERIAARAKKNAEHARLYGAEQERQKQVVNNIAGEWTGVSTTPDGRETSSTWKIEKQSDRMASQRMALYSALSASMAMHLESGKVFGPYNLTGQIDADSLSFNLALKSGMIQCEAHWSLRAKSPTEFEGVWTGHGNTPACSAAAPGDKIHLNKK